MCEGFLIKFSFHSKMSLDQAAVFDACERERKRRFREDISYLFITLISLLIVVVLMTLLHYLVHQPPPPPRQVIINWTQNVTLGNEFRCQLVVNQMGSVFPSHITKCVPIQSGWPPK